MSVSLGYALRTTDRLTPPIRASKTEAPPKTRWIPKMRKDSRAGKGDKDQKQSEVQPKNAQNKVSYNARQNESMKAAK
jgi:hypothetical protein